MRITGKAANNNFQIGNERYFYGHRVPRTWVAVVDRKKAYIYYKEAEDLELIAEADSVVTQTPGASVDPREGHLHHEEVHFARALSRWLENANNHNAFDRLVLVAAPRMLGILRADLSSHVQDKLISEIDKDVTNMSVPDIIRHLDNAVYFKDKTLQRDGRRIVGS